MQSVGGGGFTNIPGATNSFYTTASTTIVNSGTQYQCVVSNASGSVTSVVATLTVNPSPASPPVAPKILTQPVNASVTAPTIATFSVAVSGVPAPTYQWMQEVSGTTTFTAISGATDSIYITPATTTANSGTLYECVVTNASGSVTSLAASLTVAAAVAPSITAQPINVTVITPATATFSVKIARAS
jgi:hypothetical protein